MTYYRSAVEHLSAPSSGPCTLAVLSPHPDDAVLSCGGIITQATMAGQRVVVITINAGDPPRAALAWPSVRNAHRDWGLGDDAMAQRRQEDHQALALLGADGIWCDLLDRLYRDPAPRRRGRLARAVAAMLGHPAERRDAELVAERVRPLLTSLAPERVLAPLAIGEHPDHLAACRVGLAWRAQGHAVGFYEDVPYSFNREWAAHRLARFPHQREPEVHPGAKHLDRRIAAAACHRSQIAGLFTDHATLATRMREHTDERIWYPA